MIFSPHSFFIIIKNRGGHIRGHKEKLKCAKCSHLSILLFLGGMENSWRNHNACPKLLYACYGTSLGMVFDSEHTIFSHQSSNWHCMSLSTCYPFFFYFFLKHTESSQRDKALGANLHGLQQKLLEQSKIHTLVFFWLCSAPCTFSIQT